MINLLPRDQKRQIRAARSNILLVRYNVAMLAVTIFLGGAIFVSNFLLTSAKQSAASTITANQAKVIDFATVKANETSFRTSLTKAKTLLDSEIDYSSIIIKTAALMPTGSVLSSLQLDSSSFSKPIVLSAEVKGQSQAIALRNALQSSSVYTNVSFGDLSTNSGTDASTYPYTINLNVTLNKVVTQ